MALRAFRSNPSLGGFGGESRIRVVPCAQTTDAQAVEKDCDAFGQIIKELVDNAVDACSSAAVDHAEQDGNEAKRVRVVIRRLQDEDDKDLQDDTNLDSSQQILRVTVIDNGCGMENVEECVDAFRSSKAKSSNDHEGTNQELTAGRYGIGLTLCLLHAQRLVPNSYASITSATKDSQKFTRASYVVDVDGDSIKCDKIELITKKFPEETGTAVSVLVPGGQTALRAWPRLAEYFARFQLSLGLTCSLEVLAPSLSAVPLFIRAPTERAIQNATEEKTTEPQDDHLDANIETQNNSHQDSEEDHDFWTDGMESKEDSEESGEHEDKEAHHNTKRGKPDHGGEESSHESKSESTGQNDNPAVKRRRELLVAATSYLKRPISLKNVAHSIQPIRSGGSGNVEQPQLEVDMIVYSPDDEECDTDEEDNHQIGSRSINNPTAVQKKANLMLVRMVNRVPLLDGAEASACGLVRGLCWKQSTWNSFGLHVTPSDERTQLGSQETTETNRGTEAAPSVLKHLFAPTYVVRDSDQVAPFFEKSNHSQLETNHSDDDDSRNDEHDDEDDDDEWGDVNAGNKRKKSNRQRKLLPAHVRLGNILVIAQIHAKPSSLPLPTLSKGRLPMNERSIDDALELGILTCLRSLQSTNPALLLTAQELKLTERDARYIPATAAAIASIACKSKNEAFRSSICHSVRTWGGTDSDAIPMEGILPESQDDESVSSGESGPENDATAPSPPTVALFRLTTLGTLIEERLRLICSAESSKKTSRRQKAEEAENRDDRSNSQTDNDVGLDDLLDVQDHHGESDSDKDEEELGGRVLEKWEDPFSDDDSW